MWIGVRQLVAAAFAAGIFIVTLAACQPRLSGEDEVYLAAVKQQELKFDVDSAESNAAWERARQFFVLHSRENLLRDSPTALETSPPLPGDFQSYGYRILREVGGQPQRFSVDCYTLELMAQEDARLNAQILVYYIRTGKIRDFFLSGRRR